MVNLTELENHNETGLQVHARTLARCARLLEKAQRFYDAGDSHRALNLVDLAANEAKDVTDSLGLHLGEAKKR